MLWFPDSEDNILCEDWSDRALCDLQARVPWDTEHCSCLILSQSNTPIVFRSLPAGLTQDTFHVIYNNLWCLRVILTIIRIHYGPVLLESLIRVSFLTWHCMLGLSFVHDRIKVTALDSSCLSQIFIFFLVWLRIDVWLWMCGLVCAIPDC